MRCFFHLYLFNAQHECPENAYCQGGNNTKDLLYSEVIRIKPGHWLSPGTTFEQQEGQDKQSRGECGSAVTPPPQCDVDGNECGAGEFYDECGVLRKIHRCLNPDACIGTLDIKFNSSTNTTACDTANGYTGPLCQTCDNKRGFYLTHIGCDTCQGKLPAGERLAIVLAIMVVLIVIIRYVAKKLKQHLLYQSVVSHFLELVFVLFDLLQIVGSMSSIYSVRMPPHLKSFLNNMNIVSFDIVDLLGLNCFGEDVTFFAAFTMTMMIPLTTLLGCYIAYVTTSRLAHLKMKLFKKDNANMGWGRLVRAITLEIQKQRDRRSRFLVTGLSILLILYMPLTVRCFRFFQCVPIDDKGKKTDNQCCDAECD